MNGKGMTPRRGYNHSLYRANYPFPERKTAVQWMEELGIFVLAPFEMSGRVTESEFRAALKTVQFMYRKEEPETPNPLDLNDKA